MKLNTILACVAALVCVAEAAADERAECERLAAKYRAATEVRLWDATRVDLLNATHAIEVDWCRKWPEAIGQALYYALVTGRRPGVLLLVTDMKKEARFIHRCQAVCARHGITLFIEHVPAEPEQPPVVPAPHLDELPGPARARADGLKIA